jgi:hypothetical protein
VYAVGYEEACPHVSLYLCVKRDEESGVCDVL